MYALKHPAGDIRIPEFNFLLKASNLSKAVLRCIQEKLLEPYVFETQLDEIATAGVKIQWKVWLNFKPKIDGKSPMTDSLFVSCYLGE